MAIRTLKEIILGAVIIGSTLLPATQSEANSNRLNEKDPYAKVLIENCNGGQGPCTFDDASFQEALDATRAYPRRMMDLHNFRLQDYPEYQSQVLCEMINSANSERDWSFIKSAAENGSEDSYVHQQTKILAQRISPLTPLYEDQDDFEDFVGEVQGQYVRMLKGGDLTGKIKRYKAREEMFQRSAEATGFDVTILGGLSMGESSVNPWALSPVGAMSLMQIMEGPPEKAVLMAKSALGVSNLNWRFNRAKGLTGNEEHHIMLGSSILNIYTKSMKGDLLAGLASYNCGLGNSGWNAIEQFGKHTFKEVEPHLPIETQVFAEYILAHAFALDYYQEHGELPSLPTNGGDTEAQQELETAIGDYLVRVMRSTKKNLNGDDPYTYDGPTPCDPDWQELTYNDYVPNGNKGIKTPAELEQEIQRIIDEAKQEEERQGTETQQVEPEQEAEVTYPPILLPACQDGIFKVKGDWTMEEVAIMHNMPREEFYDRNRLFRGFYRHDGDGRIVEEQNLPERLELSIVFGEYQLDRPAEHLVRELYPEINPKVSLNYLRAMNPGRNLSDDDTIIIPCQMEEE